MNQDSNQQPVAYWISPPHFTCVEAVARKCKEDTGILLDLRYGTLDYCEEALNQLLRSSEKNLFLVDPSDGEKLQLVLDRLPEGSSVVLAGTNGDVADLEDPIRAFVRNGNLVGVELDDVSWLAQLTAWEVSFLLLSSFESGGPVSEKTSLVLMQDFYKGTKLPIILRAGLGPQAAAASLLFGCQGVVLDSQLLLCPEMELGESWTKTLGGASMTDVSVIGSLVGVPTRVFRKADPSLFRMLESDERKIHADETTGGEKMLRFKELAAPYLSHGFASETTLAPVGLGLVFAQEFSKAELGIAEVLEIYREALRSTSVKLNKPFRFRSGSPLAQHHGVQLPLVQGPMACVTDHPGLCVEVSNNGALPFVATASLTGDQSSQLISETREVLGGKPFGVGIVSFADPDRNDEMLAALMEARPPFVTIAGGNHQVANLLMEEGVEVYLHAPSVAHMRQFLDAGVSGLIVEGHEAGGHIGAVPSLILWELAVRELVDRTIDRPPIRLLLAGGLTSDLSSAMAAAIAAPLEESEVEVGLQLGTAYLLTDEAVRIGAIPESYQVSMLTGSRTAITGQSVNLPSRWIQSQEADSFSREETRLLISGVPLLERKRELEAKAFAATRLALEGRHWGEAGRKAPIEVIENPGLVSAGQVISVLEDSQPISKLHSQLTERAAQLIEEAGLDSAMRQQPGLTQEEAQDIAIVGIGCIFPDASGPDQFWKNLIDGRNSIREVPRDRWNPELYYVPKPCPPDKTYSKIGAFVKGFEKDPIKFKIPPISAPYIARAQFMALEVAHQALEDGGYLEKDFPRDRAGVFIGTASGGELRENYGLRVHWERIAQSIRSTSEFGQLSPELAANLLEETEQNFKFGLPEISEDSCSGVLGSIVAGRICNSFDLKGTAFTIDGACASALVAVDTAVRSLTEKRLDLALAGGVDVAVEASIYILFSTLGALSGDGSFPFDERASGFVMGEGAGLVLLKRLNDAVRDGDRIYAVIKGVGASSDGRVKGITAPDVSGQLRTLENTYRDLPFGPDTIGMIEAHGTGTRIGDITELQSLSSFLSDFTNRSQKVGVGSVKSNIGHLKSAAGIAGLIKATLALHHGVLPPTINCETPRKEFDWVNSPLALISEPDEFTEVDGCRRAAVSAFGFGGINCHVVLEKSTGDKTPVLVEGRLHQVIEKLPAEISLLSRPSRSALIRDLKAWKDALKKETDLRSFIDVGDSLHPEGPRLALVTQSKDELLAHLEKAEQILADNSRKEFASATGIYYGKVPLGQNEKIAFLFPGQGSQYPAMVGDLVKYFPAVDTLLDEIDSISDRYLGKAMRPLLVDQPESSAQRDEVAELLVQPDYNHPAIFALGIAVMKILEDAGLKPDLVAGHSLGEYLALHAAGVLETETAIGLVTGRGCRIAESNFQKGAMASVSLSAEILESRLESANGYVAIANKNCPAQTVISGDAAAVRELVSQFSEEGVPARLIPVAQAFHTPFMSAAAESFSGFLDTLSFEQPQIPVQSNLTGVAYETGEVFEGELKAGLVKHMCRPVEFIRNIESMYESGARLFVEIGPGSTLSSFVENTLGGRSHWTVQTNSPLRSPTLQLFHALALCAVRGLPVDLKHFCSGRNTLPQTSTRLSLSKEGPRHLSELQRRDLVSSPDLIRSALQGADSHEVSAYLEEREDYLKELVALDFRHFRESSANSESERSQTRDVVERVINRVAKETGYPPEVIDIDMDIEAELGIDSIKQLEIVRKLTDEFGVELGPAEGESMYKISTLRRLIEGIGTVSKEEGAFSPSPGSSPEVEEELNTTCYRWVFETIPSELPATDLSVFENKKVLLLSTESEVAELLRRRLEGQGAIVIELFSRNTFDSSCLFPFPSYVVDLRSLEQDHPLQADALDQLWSNATNRGSQLLDLGQSIAEVLTENPEHQCRWVTLTVLDGLLGAAIPTHPNYLCGLNLALLRCLQREFPSQLRGCSIDLVEESSHVAADVVFSELSLMDPPPWAEISYQKKKRYRIVPVRKPLEEGRAHLKPGDKQWVLAIGGCRGVTASICHLLARESGANFLVLGRSSVKTTDEQQQPPTFAEARDSLVASFQSEGRSIVPAEIDALVWSQIWQAERVRNLKVLKESAGEVRYCQCDITDYELVRRILAEEIGPGRRIDLVIQGGGDILDKAILDLSTEEFINGMRSKALGTATLIAALEDYEVGTFANISSTSGRFGNRGQFSYAAGHELASRLVSVQRNRASSRWLNLHYGSWWDTGMVRRGDVMDRLVKSGSSFLTREQGSLFFSEEVMGDLSQDVVFAGSEILGEDLGWESDSGASAPLLDWFRIVKEGVAESGRTFDPKKESVIADHFIEFNEPILPGFVSLEMMAQTASTLVGKDLSLSEIKDAEFLRAVRFPQLEPREVRCRVQEVEAASGERILEGEVFVVLRRPDTGQPEKTPSARATLRFGRVAAAPKPALIAPSSGTGDYRISAKPLFETSLYTSRQGVFQNVLSIGSVLRESSEGEVLSPPLKIFGSSPMLRNPLLLDGMASFMEPQLILFSERLYPFLGGFESLEFFGNADPSDVRYVRCVLRDIDEKDAFFDVEALDSLGRVAERFHGLRKVFARAIGSEELTEPVWGSLRENPRQQAIRDLLGCEGPLGIVSVELRMVETSYEVGPDEILGRLGKREKTLLESLQNPKRRLEFLAGRIAGKAAIQLLELPEALDSAEIQILKGLNGQPRVELESENEVPRLSIAHNQDVAVAIASTIDRLGVDVEDIKASIGDIRDEFCTDRETKIVGDRIDASVHKALTHLWVIKEAVRKVAGANQLTMGEVEVVEAASKGEYLLATITLPDETPYRSVSYFSGKRAFAFARDANSLGKV